MEVYVKSDKRFDPAKKYKVISIRKRDDKTRYELLIKPGEHILMDAERCVIVDEG